MIIKEVINQAIDYILGHIEEKLTLEDVAGHCHLSKFYFSRLFKEQTGESVYGFIKRVKLFFDGSSFFHHENWQVESFEACDSKITIENIPDYFVIYERRFGSYENLCRDWDNFIEKYRKFITEETRLLERTYDDPAVTSAGHCLYDICMSVGEDCPLTNTAKLQGGRCIVYHFKGHAKHIYAAYQTIFLVWLPKVSYELDAAKSLFDIYHMVDSTTMYMELSICIPLK